MTPKEGERKAELYTGYLALGVMAVLVLVVIYLVLQFLVGLLCAISMGG